MYIYNMNALIMYHFYIKNNNKQTNKQTPMIIWISADAEWKAGAFPILALTSALHSQKLCISFFLYVIRKEKL